MSVLSEGVTPSALAGQFTQAPLKQDRYAEGFGTLFTAEYEPKRRKMTLHWDDEVWPQSIDAFEEGTRQVTYGSAPSLVAAGGDINWVQIGLDYAAGRGVDWRRFVPAGVDVA